MSKVKKEGAAHYELLYIISNKFSENELAPVAAKVKNTIEINGGTITHSEEWGKKRLAYKIEGDYYGYYNLLEFNVDGVNLINIEKIIRLSPDIIRHQVIATKFRTAEQIVADKKTAEKLAIKPEEVKKEPEVKEKKDKEGAPQPKVDLKTLDKKLDEILENTDDLI